MPTGTRKAAAGRRSGLTLLELGGLSPTSSELASCPQGPVCQSMLLRPHGWGLLSRLVVLPALGTSGVVVLSGRRSLEMRMDLSAY